MVEENVIKNIGRNDLCYCGSGKKYKKCCMGDKFSVWKKNADTIMSDHSNKEIIKDLYFELLNFIDKTQWEGACHATSAIMYIILSEANIDVIPCVGEVGIENTKTAFDHSWVEIDNAIYDVAIYLPLGGLKVHPPVLRNLNIDNIGTVSIEYGCKTVKGIDGIAEYVLNAPIVEYMTLAPISQNGLWEITKEIGSKLNMTIDVKLIKNKYKDKRWVLKNER